MYGPKSREIFDFKYCFCTGYEIVMKEELNLATWAQMYFEFSREGM